MDVSRSVDEPPSVLRLLRMYDVLDSRTSFTPYSPVVSIRSSEKAMPGCHEQTTGRAISSWTLRCSEAGRRARTKTFEKNT